MFICLAYRLLLFKQNASFHARCSHFDSVRSSSGDKFFSTLRGPLIEGPEKLSHPAESRSKISKLMITELFYSLILKMNIGSLHTRSFRCIYSTFLDTDEFKKTLYGPEKFPGLLRNGPQVQCACSEELSRYSLKGIDYRARRPFFLLLHLVTF